MTEMERDAQFPHLQPTTHNPQPTTHNRQPAPLMSSTKELQEIVAARVRSQGASAALVTVVKTSGSSYRKPGARMLVDAAGHSVGSISGGCLEDDAREHAAAAIASGQPVLIRYDTTADGDIVFGSGLGCQGIVHVLIEPLPALNSPETTDPLTPVADALHARHAGALASVFAVDPPHAGPPLGSFLWLDETGLPATGTLADPTGDVARDAAYTLRRGRPAVRAYTLDNGTRIEVFIDVIRPARALLICGAGDDARPLARLGRELGWRVRVADGRRVYATRERFPDVDELLVCPAAEFGAQVTIEPGEAVVLMSHNYLHDKNYLGAILESRAGYIGVLGPRRRTERLLAELARIVRHGALGQRSRRRVHGPAGLDIGAESPEQIALSIVAEIEAVSAGRRGGVLRLRRAPLHEPAQRRDMELAA